MSGPVRAEDIDQGEAAAGPPGPPAVEVTPARTSEVGGAPVRRALPRRGRRTVGAWCFLDHLGPMAVGEDRGLDVGPHPHTGLQTVTWLVSGELLHRDSLGSEQVIRPGQLNLMTAGHGVSHAEEGTRTRRGELQGVQLWVAQPELTRHGDPAFEHHDELPQVEIDTCVATVLVGELAGARSEARRDTDHVGAELDLRPGTATLPLRAGFEHALVVLEGTVDLGGTTVTPGHLAHLGPGPEEVAVAAAAPARAILIGGAPFEEQVLMWWNFVARTREEVDAASAAWAAGGERFGDPGSPLARIPSPRPPWRER